MKRTSGESKTRWTNDEWLQVAVASVGQVLDGADVGKAVYDGQRLVLQKSRHHKIAIVRASLKRADSMAVKSLEKARAMSPEERTRVFDESYVQQKRIAAGERDAPPPPSDDEMIAKSRSNWNPKEWALIARRVEHMKRLKPGKPLSGIVIEAQDIELPPERRRSRSGIYAATSDGRLAKNLQKGLGHVWLIHNAFDPDRKAWVAPATEAPVPAQASAEPAQAATDAPGALPAPSTIPAAPEPSPSSHGPLLAASVAFGDVLAQAIDGVLRAHRQEIVGEIAARIEQGLRKTVHDIVQQELGPVEAPTGPRARVDVFAYPGKLNTSDIKSVINGAADIRFFNPHDVDRYIPPEGGAHIIFTTENIPRAAQNSIEAAGIKPLLVQQPTPSKIITAIRELVGAPVH